MQTPTKSVPSQRTYCKQPSPIKVRLWPKNREGIDTICEDEVRTLTQAVNILIDEALSARARARVRDAGPECKEAS